MIDLVKKTRQLNPPLKEKYSKLDDPKEEIEAKKALTHFVTDVNGAIYATTPLVPELFSALLKARYSRTELSAKQLLWREFVANKEGIDWQKILEGREALDSALNFTKAEGVAERILLQYGDDSVFELGGAHLFLDRVSMLASKIIEDARVGISPLEKSTRYVVFDQKGINGDFSFFKDPEIMESKFKDLYLKVNRECFEVYAKAVAIFLEYFQKQIPIEKEQFPDMSDENRLKKFGELKDEKSIKAAQVAYRFSVRSKACDVARVLLPASAFTNIGEFGNARAYGYLFTKMASLNLAEMQMISFEAVRELKKILPKFFDIVDNAHGSSYQGYLKKTDGSLRKKAKELLKGIKPEKVDRVELIILPQDPEITIAAALLYPYTNLPLKQVLSLVKKINKTKIGEIIYDSLRFRTNRRHKPPRAFELPGYELVFDILGNFGIYRDLHRQRMLTQQRQHLTTEHGFDMPLEFEENNLDKEFEQVMSSVKKAHDKIDFSFPDEAQYLTTMANYTRWYMGMNLREAFWLTELRSTPQGHFSYRTIAQDMFLKASKVYPFLKNLKAMNTHFVDMSDRSKNLERMEAMQRIQVKLAAIEDKYS
ncbi:FAD-dependent thymidylate synthase [Candidatus Daviesbacteria bacterium]|nr:FAD-dependent thymidylate synthase [Candidatus Daviesbacteria bacterium]